MKKKKKDKLIFVLYMAVGAIGLLAAASSGTISLSVILIIISAFTCWCGFVILREGTI